MSRIKRRNFITLLSGAAAWPMAARAQQAAIIGLLGSRSPEESAHLVNSFRDGLRHFGYTEGQNLTIEYRWAEGRYDRLPGLAADLVGRQVATIFSTGGAVAALAAKAATTTIPIVFISGDDPIQFAVVPNLSRPGGNVTGVSLMLGALGAKRLEFLRELIPTAATIAFLTNPSAPNADSETQDIEEAAQSLGRKILVLNAATDNDFHTAFAKIGQSTAGALVVGSDPFFASRRSQIVTLAARQGVPAIYTSRDWALSGGLMSYGTSLGDAYRQAGLYVGRILKGEKPADLPVVQSTKFEFVINLGTAKAFRLAVPPNLLAIADEVIE
jgi:putative ABC transport system substrate-binding protein